jgi:DNA mismatch repair protein MutL
MTASVTGAGTGEGNATGIRLLPPSVAERIAAGEVIDRPAAVVKELVENAIDAGATEIRVEARGGGLRLIRVADDGCGIPPDEVELAFQRHATSKLRDVEDLERVQTLGFRGEALASIAAVAEVTLVSATDGATATSCSFRAGRPLERVAAARSRGTTVTVRDLFSTMPARLKFMRGPRGEAAQIGVVVRRFALARPDLRITLVLEGHVAFRGDGSGRLAEAFAAVYGDEFEGAVFTIEPVEAAGARISGLVGSRGLTRANRTGLSLYVNGRYVRPRPLLLAIEEGYRRVLPRGRHPLGTIFLEVPPADLDVNIHPAKLDVRLRHEGAVCSALAKAVERAYGRNADVVTVRENLTLSGRQRRLPGLPRRVAEEQPAWGWGEGAALPASAALPAMRLVGQINDALIVAEGEQGAFLIDQHRAHERVIFERLQERSADERQALFEPAIMELPTGDAARLVERLPALGALGFACEEFGADRFLLRAVPASEELRELAGSFPELLHEAAAAGDDWQQRLLATIACRSAIRKGRPITPAEAHDLVRRLGAARSPAVCPHGSPVLLHLSGSFLARRFEWG